MFFNLHRNFPFRIIMHKIITKSFQSDYLTHENLTLYLCIIEIHRQ